MTTPAHTRNGHDDSYDIATGNDVASGTVIGSITWDDQDSDAGLVLRWHDDEDPDASETELADDAAEAIMMITRAGYELDSASRRDIERMVADRGVYQTLNPTPRG